MLKTKKAFLRADMCGAASIHAGVGRVGLLAAASAMALMGVNTQAAAADAAATAQAAPGVEEIVVTGSRIVRDGYEAPTPVSVLSADDLNLAATNNITDTLNRLPAFSNSLVPRGAAIVLDNTGSAGANSLNLRGIGVSRTLVLLDGQRMVNANYSTNTAPDTNLIPDGLVSRVDVVTGGASAAYGSDALAGVVNFVLDTKFTGVKGEVQTGLTTYGDDFNYKVTATAGTPFGPGDRGHLLVSVQDSYNAGVGGDNGNSRPWRQAGNEAILVNPNYSTTNGQPQYLVAHNVGLVAGTQGGLITSGPLKGTEFGPGGTPGAYTYGSIVSGQLMQGGDWATARMDILNDLDFKLTRHNLFLRASYDITDNVNLYVQHQYGDARAQSTNVANFNFGFTILSGNPYIPAGVQSQMTALKLPSFIMGQYLGDLPQNVIDNKSIFSRQVVGGSGSFDALDTGWKWDAHYQTSLSHLSSNVNQDLNLQRFNQAIDAVQDPSSSRIICRSTIANPNNGCLPFNPMGLNVNSPRTIDWLEGTAHTNTSLRQQSMAADMRGEPFSSWAGPVSLALGIEHRRESVTASADPEVLQRVWFTGNILPTIGAYNVTEGFAETVFPLAKDVAWAKSLDLNAAVRATDYSTSGYVTTWKAGATYQPIDDLRFRATRSRDIRAPNLGELFTAGSPGVGPLSDPFTGQTYTVQNQRKGNTALKPEVADTTGFGVVLQPRFFPGFTAAVDYYNIDIAGAITTLSGQQMLTGCYQGLTDLCSAFTRGPDGLINASVTRPSNILSQNVRGLDIESTIKEPLSDISSSLAGDLTLRALGSFVFKLTSANPLASPQLVDGAGVNAEGAANGTASLLAPKFKYTTTLSYTNDPITAALTVRGIGPGKYNNAFIECASACPAATAAHPTISTNSIGAVTYFDLAFNYRIFNNTTELFFTVENLTNVDPPMIAAPTTVAVYTNNGSSLFYDQIGRNFHAGVRFKM